MANKPIKISILADAGQATKSINDFATSMETGVSGAAKSFEGSTARVRQSADGMRGGMDRAVEGFDTADTRAMGFRDTMTGVQDTMGGVSAIAKGDLFTGFLTLGMGVGDLASGFANFLIPQFGAAIGWIKNLTVVQRILNITMLSNPIFLVIAALVALGVALFVAYKKSETFRNIVDGAFRKVTQAAQAAWNWIKGNWPQLLAILTGPIGIAVVVIGRNKDRILGFFRSVPGAIRGIFSGAGSILAAAGRAIISGFVGAIEGKFQSVRNTLSRLTNLLPDWKGPASVDKKILAEPGKNVIEGFVNSLEAGYGTVRKSLTNFTGSLSGTVQTDITAGTAGGASSGTQVVVSFEATGDPVIDEIIKGLRKRVRISGGNVQTVLGQG